MSYHLTDGETFRLVDNIFISIMGETNFSRWQMLKRKMCFRTEASFVEWVLNSLETIHEVGDGGEEVAVSDVEGDDLTLEGVKDISGMEEGEDGVITITRGATATSQTGPSGKPSAKSPAAGSQRKALAAASSPERRVKCPRCSKTFISQTNLARHAYLHVGVKAIACPEPQCDARFMRKDGLKSHLRHMHAQTDPDFACVKCPRRFRSESALRSHARRHPLKMFSCSLCPAARGRRFDSFRQVHAHFKREHGIDPAAAAGSGARGDEDTVFCCSVCHLTSENMNVISTHKCATAPAANTAAPTG